MRIPRRSNIASTLLGFGLLQSILTADSTCAAASFVSAGSLAQPRSLHTATLLPNGKVIAVGGASGTSTSRSSSELYDPILQSWALTGNLITGRRFHTATLLPNGNVLAAGGLFTSTPLGSAELYQDGVWTSTGGLLTPRRSHTATLLADGTVLVVAGVGSSGVLSSAEVYNPNSQSWSTTGGLFTPRRDATATLLMDGKVLVVGGLGSTWLRSSEVYDSGSWSQAGDLIAPRWLHAATLLTDGRVLVTGGANSSGTISSAEIFDPSGRTWTSIQPMITKRRGHTATLLPDGKVLVVGGWHSTAGILSSAEVYDPDAATWTETDALTTGREYHTATLLPNGKVLVVAGQQGPENILSSAELYERGSEFPAVDITSPSSGTTVNGTLIVTAIGVDDVRTVGATLLIDGVRVASDPLDSPYAFTIDTMTLANGPHHVVVQTSDIDNNIATSEPIWIQSDNLISLAQVSAPAFTPDGDGLDETITFSAQFTQQVNWNLRIRNSSGVIVRTISGLSAQANVAWDGNDDFGSPMPMETYEFSFSANPQTQWHTFWLSRRVPNWNQINFHAYHAVESGTLSQYLRTYYYTYLGLAPLTFEPHPNIYLAEIRTWNYLLGYGGDLVPEFTSGEFEFNLRTDNLVYVMAHGAYDSKWGLTEITDWNDQRISGLQIRRAWQKHNPFGFIFVQMNICQGGDDIDSRGNNDLASGFGIFNNPLTTGRAYLGWRGLVRPTNSGLYTFDQVLWDNLTSGINVEAAVADAWAQTIWLGAEPVIIGDGNLVLPDLF